VGVGRSREICVGASSFKLETAGVAMSCWSGCDNMSLRGVVAADQRTHQLGKRWPELVQLPVGDSAKVSTAGADADAPLIRPTTQRTLHEEVETATPLRAPWMSTTVGT
jgi:hypothetical protein